MDKLQSIANRLMVKDIITVELPSTGEQNFKILNIENYTFGKRILQKNAFTSPE